MSAESNTEDPLAGEHAAVKPQDIDSASGTLPVTSPTKPSLSRAASGSFNLDNAFSIVDDHFSSLTVLESRLDLWQRRIKVASRGIRHKAKAITSQAGEVLSKRNISFSNLAKLSPDLKATNAAGQRESQLEREMAKFRARVGRRVERFQVRWNDASAVSAREKASFVFGVMNICIACLMLGFRPQWIHTYYTFLVAILMPVRVYTYRQRNYHYFLLDLCYFTNLLALVFLWFLPQSQTLFLATYALTHGPLATAVWTWRNSLVFHSLEKVTSLFIHICKSTPWDQAQLLKCLCADPPLVFTTIVHFYPDNSVRFPALKGMETLPAMRTFFMSSFIYLVWQILYWYFVVVKGREKIEKGGRVTSFTYLLQHPRGFIAVIAKHIKPEHRETGFMICQYLYTVITMQPIFWLYTSANLSGGYLLLIFGISAYQGSVYYLDVFARKYEKEIIKLRQELEALQVEHTSRSSQSSTPGQNAVDGDGVEGQDGTSIPELALDDDEGSRDSGESGEFVDLSDAEGDDHQKKD